MVTRPAGRPVRVTRSPWVSGEADLEVAAERLRRRLLGGGAVDVHALDQRADGGGRLDGVPPTRRRRRR